MLLNLRASVLHLSHEVHPRLKRVQKPSKLVLVFLFLWLLCALHLRSGGQHLLLQSLQNVGLLLHMPGNTGSCICIHLRVYILDVFLAVAITRLHLHILQVLLLHVFTLIVLRVAFLVRQICWLNAKLLLKSVLYSLCGPRQVVLHVGQSLLLFSGLGLLLSLLLLVLNPIQIRGSHCSCKDCSITCGIRLCLAHSSFGAL
mmetsp:Transcript_103075/g.182651  ORF Transcript_103075/g.182651 Transcript_103075/m.182651 type:complete len:201 (-) Transcript_103075:596-1198(-)